MGLGNNRIVSGVLDFRRGIVSAPKCKGYFIQEGYISRTEKMVRVLVVGAGVTGALCAHMLRRHLPTRLQCQIIVWEKSRGVGGRMSLSRPPGINDCSLELGAQYITRHSKYFESHKEFYEELINCDVLESLTGTIDGFHGDSDPHFVCKDGLSCIAKHYFAKSSIELCTNLRLESLRTVPSESWVVWEARTTSGHHDHFDAVILTMPIPQILSIDGIKDHLRESQVADLETVEYSSRFAMGLYYDKTILTDSPYVVKYVQDSDIIRYISIDERKRGVESDKSSIVVHTSVPFSKAHLEEDPEVVGSQILQELNRIIPNLPDPTFVKCHKWRYSQVNQSTKTYGSMVARTKPLLMLTGDAFSHSNLDGCIESALSLDVAVKEWINRL